MTSPMMRAAAAMCACAALALPACTSTPPAYQRGLDAWTAATRHAEAAHPGPTSAAGPHDPARAAAPADLGADATLADAERRAREANPAVRAAAQRWRAALERVPQAVALPDPRLTFGVFLDEVETRTGPMDWRAGISQSFPWFGQLDLAGKAAVAGAEGARERHRAAGLDVVARVRDAWFEYGYVHAAIDVTRGHRDLLASWEEVARTRYATGLGTDADVIRAQVELGKLDDQVRSLQDLRRPVAARLNAALDRAPDAPLPVPELRAAAVAPDEARLAAELEHSSPALRALAWDIEAAGHQLAHAERSVYPDYSLGLEYTAISSARSSGVRGSGDDAVALTAGIGLPLRRSRYAAAAAEARARLAAAIAELSDARNTARAELELALYEVRDAERRVGLFRDTLVPKGREAVESTVVAYQAGEADFLELVDAQRVLLEFQLGAARAQVERAQALAEVERITGAPLGAAED